MQNPELLAHVVVDNSVSLQQNSDDIIAANTPPIHGLDQSATPSLASALTLYVSLSHTGILTNSECSVCRKCAMFCCLSASGSKLLAMKK